MDAIIICVPTPLNEYHEPDLSYITATAEGDRAAPARRTAGRAGEHHLSRHHRRGAGPHSGEGQQAATEGGARRRRCRQTCSTWPSRPSAKIPATTQVARRDIPKVVGGLDARASGLACELYGSIFNRTVPVSTPAAAEMTKLLENIYRCVNIALVNELKMLCLRMGIDIWEVIEAAKTKPFGFQAFYPGPGLGGHCIPIDPFYLTWKAKEYDFRTRFIELAGEINIAMPYSSVDAVAEGAESAQEGAERRQGAGAGRGLQEGHRRSARIAVADHHRTAATARRRGQLQRSLLPHRGKGPQIRLCR